LSRPGPAAGPTESARCKKIPRAAGRISPGGPTIACQAQAKIRGLPDGRLMGGPADVPKIIAPGRGKVKGLFGRWQRFCGIFPRKPAKILLQGVAVPCLLARSTRNGRAGMRNRTGGGRRSRIPRQYGSRRQTGRPATHSVVSDSHAGRSAGAPLVNGTAHGEATGRTADGGPISDPWSDRERAGHGLAQGRSAAARGDGGRMYHPRLMPQCPNSATSNATCWLSACWR
jgi:hypothetical protein